LCVLWLHAVVGGIGGAAAIFFNGILVQNVSTAVTNSTFSGNDAVGASLLIVGDGELLWRWC
jgi:hypothetical protein